MIPDYIRRDLDRYGFDYGQLYAVASPSAEFVRVYCGVRYAGEELWLVATGRALWMLICRRPGNKWPHGWVVLGWWDSIHPINNMAQFLTGGWQC